MKIFIDGMSCGHCASRVKSALEALGCTEVSVNLEGKYADVKGNPPEDMVRQAIEELDFRLVGIEK